MDFIKYKLRPEEHDVMIGLDESIFVDVKYNERNTERIFDELIIYLYGVYLTSKFHHKFVGPFNGSNVFVDGITKIKFRDEFNIKKEDSNIQLADLLESLILDKRYPNFNRFKKKYLYSIACTYEGKFQELDISTSRPAIFEFENNFIDLIEYSKHPEKYTLEQYMYRNEEFFKKHVFRQQKFLD
ncbi:hypothetical protein [Paenibacillus sp. Y412MC10]|uniref:hypothetical protein n=1 Tax=Geobacillus sp. (strain Y412MC10) TaxID=481743 RepID=UPI0011A3EAF0|nr:hypothetical protein [Paenibacillus sp. Y412MC10]